MSTNLACKVYCHYYWFNDLSYIAGNTPSHKTGATCAMFIVGQKGSTHSPHITIPSRGEPTPSGTHWKTVTQSEQCKKDVERRMKESLAWGTHKSKTRGGLQMGSRTGKRTQEVVFQEKDTKTIKSREKDRAWNKTLQGPKQETVLLRPHKHNGYEALN